MKINVVSYARFSSSNQREASIEIQQNHINKYCEENGLTIIREYVDRAQSATTDNRVEFQQMIRDAETKAFSFVVIYNTSRFCRNIQDHLKYKTILESYGVRILSVQEGFDETTPEGDLMSNFMMSINQWYSKDLARKTFLGTLESARECKHVGGVPPYGYDVGQDGKYIINDKEAEIVRMIFNMVEEGKSHREIAKILNDSGYTNRNGKPFNRTFSEIVNNRKYMGEYSWNRVINTTPLGLRSSRLEKDESQIVRVPNGMPAIVSREQFLGVQKLLEERRKYCKRTKESDYLLSGLLTCGECHYRMCGSNHRNGRGHIEHQYKCYSYQRPEVECHNKPINLIMLDTYLLNILRSVLLNEKYSKSIEKMMRKKLGKEYIDLRTKREKLTQEIQQEKETIDNLVRELSTAKNLVYQEMVNTIEKTTARKLDLETELKALETSMRNSPTIHHELILAKMIKMRGTIKDGKAGSIKMLLRHLVKEIVVGKDEVKVVVKLNAYLPLKSDRQLEMTIVEKRENVGYIENQDKIAYNWSSLKIT